MNPSRRNTSSTQKEKKDAKPQFFRLMHKRHAAWPGLPKALERFDFPIKYYMNVRKYPISKFDV